MFLGHIADLGKVRPAGQMRPAKLFCAARERLLGILNIQPAFLMMMRGLKFRLYQLNRQFVCFEACSLICHDYASYIPFMRTPDSK